MMILPEKISSPCKPQCRRNSRRGMPCLEYIVFTFIPLREAAEAAKPSQGMEKIVPPRQQLVDVALMTHVENNLILRCIKNTMKCHGQFHHAEIGCQMPAPFGDGIHNLLADFLCQYLQLPIAQVLYVLRTMNILQVHNQPSFFSRYKNQSIFSSFLPMMGKVKRQPRHAKSIIRTFMHTIVMNTAM